MNTNSLSDTYLAWNFSYATYTAVSFLVKQGGNSGVFALQGYLELLMVEPCFECTRLDAQWLYVFKTHVFFKKSEVFLVIHLVFPWSLVWQTGELLPADRRKGYQMAAHGCRARSLSEAHHNHPCRTDQWCIPPSAHRRQWPLQRASEETVDISSQFNPSGGQYYTVGTSSACLTSSVTHAKTED